MAIVDGTTADGLIMKSLLTKRRNCPLEETFPSRLLIIEVMSSYHWPYLPKRLNVKLDFIQLRASLRKKNVTDEHFVSKKQTTVGENLTAIILGVQYNKKQQTRLEKNLKKFKFELESNPDFCDDGTQRSFSD